MQDSMGPIKILNGATADGVGNNIFVKDFRFVVITISTTGLSAGKSALLKLMGSISEESPDFSASASATNRHSLINSVNYLDGTNVAGDDGYTISETDDLITIEANVNGLNWINLSLDITGADVVVNAEAMAYNS